MPCDLALYFVGIVPFLIFALVSLVRPGSITQAEHTRYVKATASAAGAGQVLAFVLAIFVIFCRSSLPAYNPFAPSVSPSPFRSHARIVLSASEPIPARPVELDSLVDQGVFAERMSRMKGLLGRTSWSAVERVLIAVLGIALVIVPTVLAFLLQNLFVAQAQRANNQGIETFQTGQPNIPLLEAERRAVFEARGIAVGVFVAMLVLVGGPWLVWKRLGQRKIDQLLNRFTCEDAGRAESAGGLKWSLGASSSISLFSRQAVILVALPVVTPSHFHPDAYLPVYMAKQEPVPDELVVPVQTPFAPTSPPAQSSYPPPPGRPPRPAAMQGWRFD
ncbi:hypothetical protein JCM1840_006614 [Sporobolomyces johnsonii]